MAPVDRDKVRAHVDFIRQRIRLLREERDRLQEDAIARAGTVRILQTSIEAIIDIANHVVARQGWGIPKTYAEALDLLVDHEVLPADQRETLRKMVRFRNRAVHLYDEIDEEEVATIVEERLGDFDLFISAIADRFLTDPEEPGSES